MFSSDLLASHPGTYACSNAIRSDLVDNYTYEKSGRRDWNELKAQLERVDPNTAEHRYSLGTVDTTALNMAVAVKIGRKCKRQKKSIYHSLGTS